MSSVNLSLLPAISFAPQSASETEAAVITAYENIAQVTLQPGDPVRLFLETLAYTLCVQNSLIDMAGKQNLLAYAREGHLDHLGALMGVARISAQPSRCLMRFSLAEPKTFEVPIPEGTRVSTQAGNIIFATSTTVSIPKGELSAETVAFAVTPGSEANGLVEGQLSQLVDPLPYVLEVSNITQTMSGTDEETDDRLRERIRLAPESYSCAGPEGSYRALALAVSQDIESVVVYSPTPGIVDVRFTLAGGELPDATMIELVRAALSDDTVRPLTDTVLVAAPDVVPYALKGTWYLRRSDVTLLSAVTSAVEQAVEKFRVWQRSQPGRDINPTRLASLVEQAGAKRIELESPAFTPLDKIQVARETAIELQFGGLEDD